MVSSDLVKKLDLTTRSIPHPYHLEWFNNCGKTKVTKSARIHFSIGSYRDYAYFDIVPMQSSSLSLGRPWEFDTDAAHHGRTNTYTLMHKDKKLLCFLYPRLMLGNTLKSLLKMLAMNLLMLKQMELN